MKNFGNVLWGIFFIIIGLIFGGNALGITNIDIFFDGWWTLTKNKGLNIFWIYFKVCQILYIKAFYIFNTF